MRTSAKPTSLSYRLIAVFGLSLGCLLLAAWQMPEKGTGGAKPDEALKIFEKKCLSCHQPNKDLVPLKVFAEAIATGDLHGFAELNRFVVADIEQESMPPAGATELTGRERKILLAWAKGKQQRRQKWVKEKETVLRKAEPKSRLRFRLFGGKTQQASFQGFLSEEDFGESTLQIESGGELLKIPLRSVEWCELQRND